MKHEIKKISKIVDELTTFCFLHGASKIDISMENHMEYFKIFLEVDNIDYSDEKVARLKEILNYPRQTEMEEYYWELAGESDCQTELCLVGMMVDKAEVEFKDSALSVVLYRNK